MGAVTSLFVRKVVAAAGSDVDQAQMLRSVGIDADAPIDPKQMITDVAYYDLMERIAQVTDVTALPLRTGASMRCDDYGALGLAFKAAPTLRGSYARVVRYARLWTSVVEYETQDAGDETWFTLHRDGVRRLGLRLSNEATLASAVAIGREVTPDGVFNPREVHISHPAPKSTHHHKAYFECPVVFGSDRDALLIDNAAIDGPNRLGDRGITQFLLGHLDQELAQVTAKTSLRERTREVIARSLSEGLPRMEDVARRLGMSVRSLHRRLADDGLSFQILTEHTRRELAEGLLRDELYTISEIAFLTGFSEQSAFNRAFKRWGGVTPANYRKSHSVK
jgi:AraC-like DNA-binding protein